MTLRRYDVERAWRDNVRGWEAVVIVGGRVFPVRDSFRLTRREAEAKAAWDYQEWCQRVAAEHGPRAVSILRKYLGGARDSVVRRAATELLAAIDDQCGEAPRARTKPKTGKRATPKFDPVAEEKRIRRVRA
jgi:hypothetical protein